MEIIAFCTGDAEGWSIDLPAPADAPDDAIAGSHPTIEAARELGWFIRMPHTFAATWTGGPGPDAVHLHQTEALPTFGTDVRTHLGGGIVSFTLPWRFHTPDGYALLVTSPPGITRPGATTLVGLVEGDHAAAVTINWKITTPNLRITFQRDEPIGMLLPVHLDALDRFRPRITTLRQDARDAPAPPPAAGPSHGRRRRRLRGFADQGARWTRTPTPPARHAPTPPPAPPATGPVTPERIFASPELYLPDFDPGTGRAVLVRMSRQTYRDSVMLDQRMATLGPPMYQVSLPTLTNMSERIRDQRRPVSFIFHTAFCGSTLLARALDGEGRAVAYKEPWILQRLAEMKRLEQMGRAPMSVVSWDDTFALLMTLLSRTWRPDERATVKPSDSCNNLIGPALAAHPDSRAIALYSNLEDFLLATLKSEERRAYARQMGNLASADAGHAGLTPRDHTAMSDAQVAAYLWFVQQRMLSAAVAREDDRLATLNGARLIEAPRDVLGPAAAHLGITLSDAEVDAIVTGPVFTRHAKMGGAYDPGEAAQRKRALREQLDTEVRSALDFAASLAPDGVLPEVLPGALMPD
ncbi:MAG: hypothetical protein KDA21_08705 [Phycisphaerales bacterium]|nr:hypothetical protein [Phycisphaerales bacterium]